MAVLRPDPNEDFCGYFAIVVIDLYQLDLTAKPGFLTVEWIIPPLLLFMKERGLACLIFEVKTD